MLLAVAAALTGLFLWVGTPKPTADWKWLDIAGEGGTALLAGYWAVLVTNSRPGGRVTLWLSWGLAVVMLGTWADCLDEFFLKGGALYTVKWLESVLTPVGMLAVTRGMLLWREEQFALSEHMSKRERLFREHRALDRVTQLADARYLLQQIKLEHERAPESAATVALIELVDFGLLERAAGRTEADRVLQAVAHQLLLNVRNRDLVCRYAGHRFVVLMPHTELIQGQRVANHLSSMVTAMRFHCRSDDTPLQLTARVVCRATDRDPEALLVALNQAVDDASMIAPLGAAGAA